MWEPPEYPGPCFDLHFDRFDGLIFEAEKPFENVCATGASPVVLFSRRRGGARAKFFPCFENDFEVSYCNHAITMGANVLLRTVYIPSESKSCSIGFRDVFLTIDGKAELSETISGASELHV